MKQKIILEALLLLVLLPGCAAITRANQTQAGRVRARDFPGADIGARINAADKSLGERRGEIIVEGGGTIATQIVVSSGHVLRLMPGTYSARTADAPILLKSGSSLIGSGWESIIVESTVPGQFTVIGAYAGTLVNGNADSNINIRDIQIKGANPGFNSAPQAISLANCSNCNVDHVWVNGTRSIGIQVGGGSFSGHWAENVRVTNCLFTRVASQNLALVNGRNIVFEGNRFMAPGQKGGPGNTSIDLEPNQSSDRMQDVIIRNNVIDHRGTEMGTTGNGIVVQAGPGTPLIGNILVENNTIIGGENHGIIYSALSNGIYIAGNTMRDVTVRNNVITRTGQAGIRVAGSRITVLNNKLTDVGGGGTAGFIVEGLRDSRIEGNTLTYTGNGPIDRRFLISGDNSRNTFQNNEGFQVVGPIR
ncbi:MAG TPA: right-handed parallel beta-helix repeat-containing protein [Pyrinomonadaceae bacterium]|nr:right-handed parallel beta-helix repeat-containing protein [Pyrinomonadaceae bacterium]